MASTVEDMDHADYSYTVITAATDIRGLGTDDMNSFKESELTAHFKQWHWDKEEVIVYGGTVLPTVATFSWDFYDLGTKTLYIFREPPKVEVIRNLRDTRLPPSQCLEIDKETAMTIDQSTSRETERFIYIFASKRVKDWGWPEGDQDCVTHESEFPYEI